MEMLFNIVSTIAVGFLTGTELAVSAFVNPVLGQVGGIAEAQATRLFAKKLGAVMPFWYGFCLLLLIAQAIFAGHQPGLAWIVAAAALWTAVMVLSVLILVPINNRIAAMTPEDFRESLRAQHTFWDRLHRGRVAILAVAMVCMLIGVRL